MNKTNEATIQDATAKALAAQVQRTLAVARIRGWKFPEECDVAVKILAATPLVTKITARMDDVVVDDASISPESATADISKVVDTLVAMWLDKHATAKPRRVG